MSDTFQVGDLAARIADGFMPFPIAVPPKGVPVLVTRVEEYRCPFWGSFQILGLSGYPVPGDCGWTGHHFRKVPPADLRDEPRRADRPLEVEPA